MVAVVDDSAHVLFQLDPGGAGLAVGSDQRGGAVPRCRHGTAVATLPAVRVSSSWPIVLDEVFAAPTWTLVLSESEDEVLGPMARFPGMFLWVVLLSGLGGAAAERQPDPAEPGAAGGASRGHPAHRAAGLRQPRIVHQPRRVRGARRVVQRHGRPAGPPVPCPFDRRRDRSGGAVGHRRRLDRRHPAGPDPGRLSLPHGRRHAGARPTGASR